MLPAIAIGKPSSAETASLDPHMLEMVKHDMQPTSQIELIVPAHLTPLASG